VSFFFVALLSAIWRWVGKGDTEVFVSMVDSLFSMAKLSVEVMVLLFGTLTLWLGFLKIAEHAGLVEKIASLLGKGAVVTTSTVASLIPGAVLRTAGALAAKVNPQVFGNLANLSAQEVGLFAGQTLEKGVLKAIEKEANSRFREEPTRKLLEYVDGTFGTAYSDAYLAYLGGKKMFKYQDGKYISAIENTANTIRGQYDYTQTQAGRVQQGFKAHETRLHLPPGHGVHAAFRDVGYRVCVGRFTS
jgi:hypothetical protein